MIRSIEQINEALAGFTDVISLEASMTADRRSYGLRITLGNSSDEQSFCLVKMFQACMSLNSEEA